MALNMPLDVTVRCSVIIPTLNRAHFLPRSVESVRGSDVSDAEVIVVDAGSTDETPRVVGQFDPPVKYVRLEHAGPSQARNAGARIATGRYLAFLDDDDRWLPHGRGRLLEVMDQAPEVALAFGDALNGSAELGYRRISETVGPSTLDSLPGRSVDAHIRILDRERFYGRLLENGQPVIISATIVRRDAFEYVGGFAEHLTHAEDWDLFLRLARRFPTVRSDEVCAVHERHTGNASRNLRMMHENAIKCLQGHLNTEIGLSARERNAIHRLIRGYFQSLGYAAFDRGDLTDARSAYRASLGYGSVQLHSAFYYLVACLPAKQVRSLRRVKQSLASRVLWAHS
jgi:glycosyltransferase involved in cell wall biosynthesis